MRNPAETYEREMVPALFAPWVPELLDLARPRAGERVIDLACGTGIVARQVAGQVGPKGRVVGLDMNPAMLEVAREAAAREHGAAGIEWCEGRMESLPFGDGEFDLVLCQQGLQFAEDRMAALSGAHRVLRGGGRIVVAVWQSLAQHPLWSTFNEALVRHLGIPALAAPFCLDRAEELRSLLAAAGFGDISIESRSLPATFADPSGFVAMEVDVIAAAIPAARHLDTEARAHLTAALSAELECPIRARMHGGSLTVRMHANLARATA
jgi:ubiquinone/menaquinone biosynthesis C-methylase UbiE